MHYILGNQDPIKFRHFNLAVVDVNMPLTFKLHLFVVYITSMVLSEIVIVGKQIGLALLQFKYSSGHL